jgi:hypothetical protein
VPGLVAFPAERDEIRLRVVTESASPSHVVNVQIPKRSALLAAPTVALQNDATQHRIRALRRSNSWPFLRSWVIHFALPPSKPVCSEPANKSPLVVGHPMFGSDLPVSKAALARKSAQIISGQ